MAGTLRRGAGAGKVRLPGTRLRLLMVTTTEDLLTGEHAAWTERMTKTIPVPPLAPKPAEPANPG